VERRKKMDFSEDHDFEITEIKEIEEQG